MFKNISFIGAGKVGINLAKYFIEKNYKVNGFFSKSNSSCVLASNYLNVKSFNTLEELILTSDFIFITTPDDEILNIWNNLKRSGNLKNKFIAHVSGSLSSKVFSNINDLGAYGFSVHPMWAFSDKYTSHKGLEKAYFSLEGNKNKINIVQNFINSLGNKTLIINEKDKSLYHLANVTVSNLILSLVSLGANYLSLCGVEGNKAKDALMPLIINNISNIQNKNIIDSLTGPIERCDLGTIKHHLEVIPKENLEIYKLLSLNLVNLCKIKNPHRDYKTLKKFLMEV